MPVGVVLIVDQAHVQDVLRAFANSRLRFQNTQYHLQRFRDVISLDTPEMSIGGGPIPGPGMPAGPGAGPPGVGDIIAKIRRGRRGGPGGGKRGMNEEFRPAGGNRREGRPPPAQGGFDSSSGSNEEEDNTLVELTVYGLISLYERFPPKAPAGTPGASGTPTPAAAVPAPAAPPPVPNAPVPPPAPTGGSLPPPVPPGPNPTAPPPAKTPG